MSTKNKVRFVIDLDCPVEVDVSGANKIAAELFYVLDKHVKVAHPTYRVDRVISLKQHLDEAFREILG